MKLSTLVAIAIAAVTLAAAVVALISIAPSGNLAPVTYLFGWLAFSLVGALLGARRAQNPVGWIFATIGLTAELGLSAELLRDRGALEPGTALGQVLAFLGALWFVAFQLLAALLIVFPSGRPPSPRWRIALWLIAINIPLGVLTSGADPAASIIGPPLSALVGNEVAVGLIGEAQGVASIAMTALTLAGAGALAMRLRRARGIERQQLKWVALAGGLVVFAIVGTNVAFFSPLRAFDPDAPFPAAMFGGVPVVLALVSIPLAAGTAILRYRLYDIDLLINRTLVYGATSATLVLTYALAVLALGTALRPFTQQSELAVAGSTLAVAALVQPVRRRIQSVVDRRFYRSRYDAERTVDHFAARLREEVDLDALRGELVGVVRDTVRPAHASLWLREPK